MVKSESQRSLLFAMQLLWNNRPEADRTAGRAMCYKVGVVVVIEGLWLLLLGLHGRNEPV